MRISDWSSDVCSSDLATLLLRLGNIVGIDARDGDRIDAMPRHAPSPYRPPADSRARNGWSWRGGNGDRPDAGLPSRRRLRSFSDGSTRRTRTGAMPLARMPSSSAAPFDKIGRAHV